MSDKCRIPACQKPPAYSSNLCGGHHGAWGASGEFKRATAAMMDFVNRIDAEERNAQRDASPTEVKQAPAAIVYVEGNSK